MHQARLYVLTDGADSVDHFRHRTAEIIRAGADVVQLRDKRLSDRDLLGRAAILVELAAGTSTHAIINDRADIARLVSATGVHLGQDDLSVSQARQILNGKQIVGVSTHSVAQARVAFEQRAEYIGVGPTFPSATKNFDDFTGLDLLRRVADALPSFPAFAIGGISPQNVAAVLETGIHRIAVSHCVIAATEPGAVIHALKEVLSRH
ncbi:MAG: thiamine phosphate synthase [Planctomycetales bacterium]|nr:thiamine phosphate synthase [Planctomycetales bacterium]